MLLDRDQLVSLDDWAANHKGVIDDRDETSSFGSCASSECDLLSDAMPNVGKEPAYQHVATIPKEDAEKRNIIWYEDTGCVISFDPHGGPGLFGLLKLSVKPGPIDAEAVQPALGALCSMISDGTLKTEFVSIYDISQMSTPSVFSLPKLIQIFKQNLDKLESFQLFQQSFAVVRGRSRLFNLLVDAFVGLSKVYTKPIFTPNQEEALTRLDERFGHTRT